MKVCCSPGVNLEKKACRVSIAAVSAKKKQINPAIGQFDNSFAPVRYLNFAAYKAFSL